MRRSRCWCWKLATARMCIADSGWHAYPSVRATPSLVVKSKVYPELALFLYAAGRNKPYHGPRRPLRCPAHRDQMVRALAAGRISLRRRAQLHQAEVLRAGNVALSLGRPAHGTRAQLRHRRRARPLHVDERLQRASSHGLGFVRPSRGECRHFQQHAAARVDPAATSPT